MRFLSDIPGHCSTVIFSSSFRDAYRKFDPKSKLSPYQEIFLWQLLWTNYPSKHGLSSPYVVARIALFITYKVGAETALKMGALLHPSMAK
jgi:hypothetical protein